jgi:uncharacterized membrane protein YgcG
MSMSRGILCWVVTESYQNDFGGMAERRVVAVFVSREQAVASAAALWSHLKATIPTSDYTYQEIREDASTGTYMRRLGTVGGGFELRQVAVEAPAYLNPTGDALRECTATSLEPSTPFMALQHPSMMQPHSPSWHSPRGGHGGGGHGGGGKGGKGGGNNSGGLYM